MIIFAVILVLSIAVLFLAFRCATLRVERDDARRQLRTEKLKVYAMAAAAAIPALLMLRRGG